uniref:NADPH oxidase activator 1 n=1 Tax=Salarias fasciatus TaxID=181472 RepID=A0A672GGQ2_SALFA
MLYTELLKLWDQSVQAVDAKDWQGALAKLDQISEPTSRTLFNAASAHLALDLTIAKDERLAVGFFQRAAVMQIDRLEEALTDCIWAQKHMRGNAVIDYKQLGLRFNSTVLYNAAAVYCRMNQWDQANDMLLTATQERGGGGAAGATSRKEILEPLVVPEGVVFRPSKQHMEQLQQRDFLGKAKVRKQLRTNLFLSFQFIYSSWHFRYHSSVQVFASMITISINSCSQENPEQTQRQRCPTGRALSCVHSSNDSHDRL